MFFGTKAYSFLFKNFQVLAGLRVVSLIWTLCGEVCLLKSDNGKIVMISVCLFYCGVLSTMRYAPVR